MLLPALCCAILLPVLAIAGVRPPTEADVRRALLAVSGTVRLPAGVIEITSELEIPRGAHDLNVLGDPAGTVLHAAASFQGAAVLSCRSATRIQFTGFTIDGNREALEAPLGLPPSDVSFARFYPKNGLLVENTTALTLTYLQFRNIPNFAILVGKSAGVRIQRVSVEDSGSRNSKGRNNTTGGILFEEGTSDFVVEDSRFRNVRGNGVWTHSMYRSPRNEHGRISGNTFEGLARDAIQAGHAKDIVISNNTGSKIGYPTEEVDVEGYGFPVAIDTAGNVERAVYADNRFEEVNGKCVDLDGFHHGIVRGNTCTNRGGADVYPFGNYGIAMNNANPDMRSEYITIADNTIEGAMYGGILVIGGHNVIRNNHLRNLNLAHCNENAARCYYGIDKDPDILRSGIYLARGAERADPAHDNQIEGNEISGYQMKERCVVSAPGIAPGANQLERNTCGDRLH